MKYFYCLLTYLFFNVQLAQAQINSVLKAADSLYNLEDYQASYPLRAKYLTTLPVKSNDYIIQKAKLNISEFYIQQNKTGQPDTALLTTILQNIYNKVNTSYAAGVYIDATFALAKVYNNNNNKEWLSLLNKLTQDQKIMSLADDVANVTIYYAYATFYGKESATYNTAANYYKKAIAIASKPNYSNPSNLALLYNDYAILCEVLGQKDKTLDYYQKAHEIWWKNYRTSYINNNITGLGDLVAGLSDYGKHKEATAYLDTLMNYFNWVKAATKSKQLPWRTTNDNHKSEFFILLTAIRCYSSSKNEQQMLQQLQQLETLLKTNAALKEEYINHLIEAYETVALYYREVRLYDLSIAYFKKAAAYPINDFYKMKAAANMAVTYNFLNQGNEALPYANTALSFFNTIGKNRTSYYGLMATKAELLHKAKKYAEATKVLDTLYNILLENKKIDLRTVTVSAFANHVNATQVIVLIKTGNVYTGFYKQTKELKYLQTAYNIYTVAANLFKNYYSREFYNSYIDNLNKQINDGLLETAVLLGNTNNTNLLNLVENNVSQQLWKKFISRYSQNITVPDTLLTQRNSLVAELSAEQLKDAKSKTVVQLTTELQKINTRIEQYNKSFLTFSTQDFSVISLQQKLQQNEAVLRYYMADSLLFVFTVTQQNIALHKVANVPFINNLINKIKTEITSISNSYKNTATVLYNSLLKNCLPTSISKVIIIPDGDLSFLPFELLYNSNTNNYFVHQTNISYAYSLPIWLMQQNASINNKGTVAFAPAYPQNQVKTSIVTRGGLYDLVNAKTEAQTIASLYNGKYFGNEAATKQNFLHSLGKYNVYHLAMHAVVDEEQAENSNLIFSNNERLYFKQLYEINFPSSMVVLSACNTGIGAMETGEGLMSLSRALTYSGVQSAVYSLWEVPDEETAEIMIAFYKNLAAGQAKDEALANAKKTFLEKNPLKQHPYYWAGFVLNGNKEPIKKKFNWWWLVMGGVVVVGGVWLFRRLKKN